jgi:hypothetical protein
MMQLVQGEGRSDQQAIDVHAPSRGDQRPAFQDARQRCSMNWLRWQADHVRRLGRETALQLHPCEVRVCGHRVNTRQGARMQFQWQRR